MVAHLLGIPLALAILLIPSRPYEGYEAGRTSGGISVFALDSAICMTIESTKTGMYASSRILGRLSGVSTSWVDTEFVYTRPPIPGFPQRTCETAHLPSKSIRRPPKKILIGSCE
jgi:hypothetical protein